MSQTACIPPRRRCPHGALVGASAAFALALFLAACQGGLSPDTNASGQSSSALMRVADDTRAGGDPGTAVSLYRRVHEMRPTDPKPLAKLGSTLTELGSYTEAAEAFRAGLELSAHDPDLHRGLAVVLLSLNQPEAAINEANAALAKKSDDPRLYNVLGVAHDLMGHHDLAQEDYLSGLRLSPKSAGLRNNYGLSLALSGDYGAAATTLSEVAEDTNAPPRYRLNLALVYGLAGDDKKASAIARTALDETAVRNNLAYYAMLRHMNDKARAAAIIGGQLHNAPSEVPPPAAQTAEATPPTPPTATAADKDAPPAPGAAAAAPTESAAAAGAAPPTDPSAPSDATAPAASAATEAAGPPIKLTPANPSDADGQPPLAATEPATPSADAPNSAAAAPDAAPSAPPEEAPPTALAPAAEAAAPAPATEAATAAAPAPADKPPSTVSAGTFVVQFGSFSIEGNAHKLAEQLGQKGYKVAVVRHRDQGGREWYAVRGGYPSAAEAQAAARHVHDTDQLPAVVLRHAGQA